MEYKSIRSRKKERIIMKGMLALHRIIISYKELCKTGSIDLTYNEFIVMIALNENANYIGKLNNITLIDKGQLVRILGILIKKGLVDKKKESLGHSYFLTKEGERMMAVIESQANDDIKGIPLTEEEKKARDSIISYERKLQRYTFNNRDISEEADD